jgi:hypothetical protein
MLKYVTIKVFSVKGSSMWQVDFTMQKAQACDNHILLSERLKYVTIRFYSVKDSSMLQLDFIPWRTQVCYKYIFHGVKSNCNILDPSTE